MVFLTLTMGILSQQQEELVQFRSCCKNQTMIWGCQRGKHTMQTKQDQMYSIVYCIKSTRKQLSSSILLAGNTILFQMCNQFSQPSTGIDRIDISIVSVLRLIYFSKSKEHAAPFFLKSNCLPLSSIFFRDCSYLLDDINRQTTPVSILNQFVKTSQIHNYRTRSVSSDSFYVKFSRTDKMYAFFTRIGAQIWNSIPYSIKILKRSSFRKKIKELLLNFLRSEDDYVEVSRLIK